MKIRLACQVVPAVVSLVGLGGCSSAGCRRATQVERFEAPAQFLVDKEEAEVVVATVKRARSRWVILPDGDHLPLVVAECVVEKTLAGKAEWATGATQAVMQFEDSELLPSRVAPPVIEGRRYVLWAIPSPSNGEVPPLARWTAHPQGFLQIRGQGSGEFVYWNHESYSVQGITAAVGAGQRLPLDRVVDPLQRIRVAEARLARNDVGDEQAFVRGLLVNVTDPEGESRKVRQARRSPAWSDTLDFTAGEGRPHSLWYQSLALLRDFGKGERQRPLVVKALTPIAQTARPPVRRAAALALVDLGSDAGRAALIEGLAADSGAISADPPDEMTFPGRYPYDGASTTACAHALARIGDYRGLRHASVEVRLAAAEGVKEPVVSEVRLAVESVAREIQPQVDELRAKGALGKARAPGDYTNRYPAEWLRAQKLLARMGDDAALGRLVEAYLADAATYPKLPRQLVPTGRPVSWSPGPSLATAIAGAGETPALVLERLEKAYAHDARWDAPALAALRASLERPETKPQEADVRPRPTEAEVAAFLANSDPNQRAEGLAGAGYNQMRAFRDKVLAAATRGGGVERQAAVYALGFYEDPIPEPLLQQLLASPDFDLRLQALEIATRANASRLAPEAMAMAHEQAARSADAKPDDFDAKRGLEQLPRLLCRLARGPLPKPLLDGLTDPDPVIRRVVVRALELSGNPDAVPALRPLATDPDPAVREAVRAALAFIGPAE